MEPVVTVVQQLWLEQQQQQQQQVIPRLKSVAKFGSKIFINTGDIRVPSFRLSMGELVKHNSSCYRRY